MWGCQVMNSSIRAGTGPVGAGLPANASVASASHSRVNPLPQGRCWPLDIICPESTNPGAWPGFVLLLQANLTGRQWRCSGSGLGASPWRSARHPGHSSHRCRPACPGRR
ncbi:hypothetical protein D0O09_06890 [Pseudomonas putida]|nr:hypothetical protein D0O09_06890 [Pseudomonas putida]